MPLLDSMKRPSMKSCLAEPTGNGSADAPTPARPATTKAANRVKLAPDEGAVFDMPAGRLTNSMALIADCSPSDSGRLFRLRLHRLRPKGGVCAWLSFRTEKTMAGTKAVHMQDLAGLLH